MTYVSVFIDNNVIPYKAPMINSLLSRTSSPRGLSVLLGLQLLIGGMIATNVPVLGDEGMLDFQIGHSRSSVAQVLDSYDPSAHRAYRNIQRLDLFNPLLYATLTASLIWLLLRGGGPNGLVATPFLAAFFDYGENYAIARMMRSYPAVVDADLQLAHVLSLGKWATLGLMLVAVVVAAGLRRSRASHV